MKSSLHPRDGDEQRALSAVAVLIASLGQDNPSAETAARRAQAWRWALENRPALEVEEAAVMWVQRQHLEEGERREFVPRPAQIVRLADIAHTAIEREIATIENILKARPPSEVEFPLDATG